MKNLFYSIIMGFFLTLLIFGVIEWDINQLFVSGLFAIATAILLREDKK